MPSMDSWNWNRRFIGLAEHVAQWSKDGSTRCGAVIVRPNKSIASLGFNGFPQGVRDDPEMLKGEPDPQDRVEKLKRVIHAEMNALLFLPERSSGLVMYVWPMLPCHRCAVHVIQAGIGTVIAPRADIDRWRESIELSKKLFAEARVIAEEIDYEVPIGGSGGSSAYPISVTQWGTRGGQGGPNYDL